MLVIFSILINTPARTQTGSDSVNIVRLTKALTDYVKTNNLDKAKITVDSILLISESKGFTRKKADCYYNYSLIERKKGNIDGSLKNASKAAEIYLEAHEPSEAARSYTMMAQMYIDQKQFTQADELYNKSLQIRDELKDSAGAANNLINLGNLRYIEGKYEDASEFFYRALRLANLLGNNNLVGITLMNMANVLTKQNNYDKAIEYLRQALEYHRKEGNRKEESNVLHNIGINYLEKKDYTEARNYFSQALAIKEALKTDAAGIIKIYNNLGLMAKEEGNPELAEKYYAATLRTAHQSGDKHAEAAALNNLGSLKNTQGNPDALDHLLGSLKIAQKLGWREMILTNYGNLKEYYSQRNDWEKAFIYAQKYNMLDDSIFYEESAARIIELQTRYDTEMKEKENQILRDKQKIHMLRNRLLSMIVVILSLLAVSFYIMFRLKRQSLKKSHELFEKEKEISTIKLSVIEEKNKNLEGMLFAEEEIKKLQARSLEQKKQELISATMLIANKNEVFVRLKKLAEEIKSNGQSDGYGKAREIITEIDRQTDFETQWEQFKIHFESLHSQFLDNLNRSCNNLTQHDLQMCAYIKLNLTAKEIARLMNIAPESVNTHRYRLRKKLNLPAEITLDDFIQGL